MNDLGGIAITFWEQIIKEKQVFEEEYYSQKINKTEGTRNSMFMVWQVKQKSVTLAK